MAFCVRVPVLSVQITVVELRVSTADGFLTNAFFLAIRCTLNARDRLTVGIKPSGMFATIIPMAKINAALTSISVRKIETQKAKIPMVTAKVAKILVIRWI